MSKLNTVARITAILIGVAMSTQAVAGNRCKALDLDRNHTINAYDATTLKYAIVEYNTGNLDYNLDRSVDVLDITAIQADTEDDILDFSDDVIACTSGDLDLNSDGVTDVLDVVMAKSKSEKLLIAQCAFADPALDYNLDGEVNVLDITNYVLDANAETNGFILAVAAEITGSLNRLDFNHDGELSPRDSVTFYRAMSRCR